MKKSKTNIDQLSVEEQELAFFDIFFGPISPPEQQTGPDCKTCNDTFIIIDHHLIERDCPTCIEYGSDEQFS